MKKHTGIIIATVVVVAIVALLVANRIRLQNQTSEVLSTDRAVAVKTIELQTESISSSFTANGTVQALKELNFVSDISGRVVGILADKGKYVRKGTALLKLDSQLYEADYKAAKAAYEAMLKDEQRFTRSNQAGGVTAQQLDGIRTQLVAAESRLARSRKMFEDCTVKAPISGKINFRYVEAGSLIAPNVPLFDIVDDSALKVICNVPEQKMRLLQEGQAITLSSSSLPGETFSGRISYIGIKTDRGLNYPVEIILSANPKLQIGMYLKASFEGRDSHDGILVPRKAIVGSAKSATVFVVADGKAHLREVTLGDMVGDRVEILSGVSAGEQLAIAGIMNLADGEAVKIVNE